MKHSLAPLLLVALAGCGLLKDSEMPEVRLEADQASYQVGQDVVLSLINFSERTFTIRSDLCDAVLERQEKTTWKPIHGDGVCLDIGVELKLGSAIVSRKPLDDTLSAGSYRYMYELRDGEVRDRYRHFERIELYTRVFEVSQ